jgi:hypothetical protein
LRFGFTPFTSQRQQQLVYAIRAIVRAWGLRDLIHSIILDGEFDSDILRLWMSMLATVPNIELVLPSTSQSLLNIQHAFGSTLAGLLWLPLRFIGLWIYMRPALIRRESFRMFSVLSWIAVFIPFQFYRHFFIYPWTDVNLAFGYDLDSLELSNGSSDANDDDRLGPNGNPNGLIYVLDVYQTALHGFTNSLVIMVLYLFNWFSLGDSLRDTDHRGVMDISNPDSLWFSDKETETAYTMEYALLNRVRPIFVATSILNWVDIFLRLQLLTAVAMMLYRRRPILSGLLGANVNHVGESVLWAYLRAQIFVAFNLPTPFGI